MKSNLDKKIRCQDIKRAYRQNKLKLDEMCFEDGFKSLLDCTYKMYRSKQAKILIDKSNLRYTNASLRCVDFYNDFCIEGASIKDIVNCNFVSCNQAIIIEANPGYGKTYLGCAIAKRACERLVDTYYVRFFDLKRQLDEIKRHQDIYSLIDIYSKYTLLVIDDWVKDIAHKQYCDFLYEVIENRYKRCLTIICTQYQKKDWMRRLESEKAQSLISKITDNAIWIRGIKKSNPDYLPY